MIQDPKRLSLLLIVWGVSSLHAAEWPASSSVRVTRTVTAGPGLLENHCGSGTVVRVDDGGYDVLTCYHVAQPHGAAGTLWVKAGERPWRKARCEFYWDGRDLALLRVDDPNPGLTAAKLASSSEYAAGLAVTKCGYPGAGARHIASGACTGSVSASARYAGFTSAFVAVPSRSGDSGGGLFRDSDHALVGVVWGSDNGPHLYATRIEDIHTLLRFAEQRRKARTPAR